MRLVFEASQIAEAHIIKHLLERAGLFAAIHGEHLQSGVGEIPASGLLRVMTNDADYNEAKSIIQAWDEAEWDENAWQTEIDEVGKT